MATWYRTAAPLDRSAVSDRAIMTMSSLGSKNLGEIANPPHLGRARRSGRRPCCAVGGSLEVYPDFFTGAALMWSSVCD